MTIGGNDFLSSECERCNDSNKLAKQTQTSYAAPGNPSASGTSGADSALRFTPPAPHPRNFAAGAAGADTPGGKPGGAPGGATGGRAPVGALDGALGLPGGALGLAGGSVLCAGACIVGGGGTDTRPASCPVCSIVVGGSANLSSSFFASFGGGPGGNGGGLNVESASGLGANACDIIFSRSRCLNDFAPCRCPGCPISACSSTGGGGPGNFTCLNLHSDP
jgi:hypothetical protein